MSLMFSDAEIAELRALEESAMPDTFQLVSDTYTKTGGGRTKTGETIQASGACRLRLLGVPGQGSTREQAVVDRMGWQAAYALDLPIDVTVDPAWRIVVNGTRTFQIRGVFEVGAWALIQTLAVEEGG